MSRFIELGLAKNPETYGPSEKNEVMVFSRMERLNLLKGSVNRMAEDILAKIPADRLKTIKTTLDVGLNWVPLLGDIKMMKSLKDQRHITGEELGAIDNLAYTLILSAEALALALTIYAIYKQETHSGVMAGVSHAASDAIQFAHTLSRGAGSFKELASKLNFSAVASVFDRIVKMRELTVLDI